MLISVEIDAWEAGDTLAAAYDLLASPKLGDAAGAFAANRIVERTLRGRDVSDAFFAPYAMDSPKSGIPNLYETGAMLGSVVHTPSGPTRANINCPSPTAKYHQEGTFRMPRREFIGLSARDKSDMLDEVFTDPLMELVG